MQFSIRPEMNWPVSVQGTHFEERGVEVMHLDDDDDQETCRCQQFNKQPCRVVLLQTNVLQAVEGRKCFISRLTQHILFTVIWCQTW